MRRAVLILTIAGLALTALYLKENMRYALGTGAQPGPGFYPLLVGVLLALGFTGTGLEAITAKQGPAILWPEGAARWRVLAIAAAAIGYALLLPFLGHPIAGTLLMLVVLETMGLRSWPVKIALSVAMGVGSYYLFYNVLGVPLPGGLLFD